MQPGDVVTLKSGEVELPTLPVDANGKCECGLEASFAAPEAHAHKCSYRLAIEAERAMLAKVEEKVEP